MTEAYLHVYAEEETITPDVSVPPGPDGFSGSLERLIAILANRLVMVSGEASVTATPGVSLAQEVAARRALAETVAGLLVASELPLKMVRAATTADINLTTGGLLTVDGIALAAGDRVLVKSQSVAAQNGIYAAATGAWPRATDADSAPELPSGTLVVISEGTTYADQLWTLTTNSPIAIGTTALTFGAISSGGGAGGAHASTHVSTGSDPIPGAVAGGASGLMAGADKTKLDGMSTNAREFVSLVGSGVLLFNNVGFVAGGSVLSGDLRGLSGIPADARGILLQVGGGAAGTTIYIDSADSADQVGRRHGPNSSNYWSPEYHINLATGANAGKIKLSSSAAQSGIFAWAMGYWR